MMSIGTLHFFSIDTYCLELMIVVSGFLTLCIKYILFRWTLIGVTSAGFGCAVDKQPGIYHKVCITFSYLCGHVILYTPGPVFQ